MILVSFFSIYLLFFNLKNYQILLTLLSYNMLHLLVFLFIYMFKIFTNITNLNFFFFFFSLCPDFLVFLLSAPS